MQRTKQAIFPGGQFSGVACSKPWDSTIVPSTDGQKEHVPSSKLFLG